MPSIKRCLIAGAVAVQVLVPGVVLATEGRPARFGWQMVATKPEPLRAMVVTAGGEREVDVRPILVRERPEVDYTGPLAARLCATVPSAVAVRLTRADPHLEARIPCRRAR